MGAVDPRSRDGESRRVPVPSRSIRGAALSAAGRRPAAQPSAGEPDFDPRLPRLLEDLPERQRVAVVLVCIYDWSYPRCAEVLGVSESTVRTHVRRGLYALRRELGDTE